MRKVTVVKQLVKNTNSLAHVQKIPFLQMSSRMPFKKYRANDLEETFHHTQGETKAKQLAKGAGYLH